mgnify:CR=1 FL=1
MRGKLITFEGIDGSGKTTMLRRVARELERLNVSHIVTHEPGGTELGVGIRELVLAQEMGPITELFLYAADRAEHVRRVIRPALEEGRIVLSDRYADATLAYQGYGRGLPLELVRAVNRWATDGLLPDLTIVLDCDVQIALGRKRPARALDRFEQSGSEFLHRVRTGYLEIARDEPERVRVISSAESEEVTAHQVWEAVAAILRT